MTAEIWRLIQWWWRNLNEPDKRKRAAARTFAEHAMEYVMAVLIFAFMIFVLGPIGQFLHDKFFPRPTSILTAEAAAANPTPVTQYAAPFPRQDAGNDTPSPTPHHRKHHHATEPS